MRIAFVFDAFFPEKGGESYFSWLTKELAALGHEVHLFAGKGREGTGYTFHRLPVVPYPPSLRLLSFLLSSRIAIQRGSFHIVHGVGHTLTMNVFNPHGGVEVAYLKGEFYSIRNRGYYALRYLRRHLGFKHHLLLSIQKRQYESKDVKKIIAISPMIKEHILQYFSVPEDKIRVVMNSVDLERFTPANKKYRASVREALGLDEKTVALLFAGNNFRLKGLEPLILSVPFLRKKGKRPVKLLVAGRGKKGRYERMARREGVAEDVIFLGPVGAMEKLYAASDIYVHPTFYDSCSLTVLEALASGLPVVTSQFNGAKAAIQSQEGLIVRDPWDIMELSEAILHFFDDTIREEAQASARRSAERLSPSSNLQGILHTYEEVLKGGTGTREDSK